MFLGNTEASGFFTDCFPEVAVLHAGYLSLAAAKLFLVEAGTHSQI
jgi:hypothetical protein